MRTNPGCPPERDRRDLRDVYAPAASPESLARRAGLLRQLREFFHRQGLLEVETPAIARDIVVERYLRPWTAAPLPAHGGAPSQEACWLQPSPELHMKRILAAHGQAIYQVCHAFRAGEAGRLHNPEFTLVEWYRPKDSMDEGMAFLDLLCQEMLNRGPCHRLSYGEAFMQYAGVDPHGSSVDELREAAASLGITVPPVVARDDPDAWLNLLLTAVVEQNLGRPHPTLLYHYPASQAALARIVDISHPRGRVSVAERFELYVDGIELANGYHELLDPGELRRRAASLNQGRLRDGDPPLPEENRLLAAMESGLLPCSGVALGFDRLVMLATGASSIREVMAFPADIA